MSDGLAECVVCRDRIDPELMTEHYKVRHPEEAPVAQNNTPLNHDQTLRVIGFILIVLPLAIPLNVIAWRIATGSW